MQPKIELLTQDLIDRILDEAFQLMMKPGIKVQYAEARELLGSAGCEVDEANAGGTHPGISGENSPGNGPQPVLSCMTAKGIPRSRTAAMPSTLIPVRPACMSSIPKRWNTNRPIPQTWRASSRWRKCCRNTTRNPRQWSATKCRKKSATCTACTWY